MQLEKGRFELPQQEKLEPNALIQKILFGGDTKN
jgi:hypothetical protein